MSEHGGSSSSTSKQSKDMNGNAVHVALSAGRGVLDLCDELGLYVLDEIGGWQKFYDTDIGTKIVEEMVTRDVNHPSILFWDNGNEGGFNTNLDKVLVSLIRKTPRAASVGDVQRVEYHALSGLRQGRRPPWAIGLTTGRERVATNDPVRYIYMPTEFMHGLYDGRRGGGLEDYWTMMMKSPLCAGGFIWAFADEGIRRSDTGQIDVAGNQAPDGIVGPYREREGSFYAIKEIWEIGRMGWLRRRLGQ